MIKGVHTMFYSSDPEGLRTFLKEKINLKATDVGGGWLIFELPEADMGVHPAAAAAEDGAPSGTADISFYCENIHKTVSELKAQGVEFTSPVEEHSYGWVTRFYAPGDFSIQLYEPKYRLKP